MTDSNLTTPPPKRRGCLFYGCLISGILLLLAVALVIAGVYILKKQIYAWTDPAPVQLPKVELADSELKKLQERLTSFHDAMEQGKSAEPLVLTDREINAIIAKAPKANGLADKVHVALDNDKVKGQVSIPLNGLGWLGKGRYLNGEAAFNVSLANGVLIVTAQEIQVQGKQVPDSFMSAFRKENLAKEVYKDPEHAEFIRKLDTIQVQDSKLIIKARSAQ